MPLAKALNDTWEQGDAYEQYVGRWSRHIARRFLSWLALPHQRRWLDVGCGTGALLATILDDAAPTTLIGVDSSAGFLQTAERRLAGRAALRHGGAERLPLADSEVDVAVCGLALNFFTNPVVALNEMTRVTVCEGTIAAYVWDYAGKMELMRHFWDAAKALDERAITLDEGVRFPLCAPLPLHQLFEDAGLRHVEVSPIDIETRFADFDDCWRPFLGGQGPAPAYAISLDAATRDRLREGLRERLPTQADGSIALSARAWAVRGTKR